MNTHQVINWETCIKNNNLTLRAMKNLINLTGTKTCPSFILNMRNNAMNLIIGNVFNLDLPLGQMTHIVYRSRNLTLEFFDYQLID